MKKKVFIVGGSGKIGNYITNYLAKKNEFEIIIVDKNKPKFINIKKCPLNVLEDSKVQVLQWVQKTIQK